MSAGERNGGVRRAQRLGENLLDLLLGLGRRVCWFGALMGGVLFFAAAILISVEVVIRKAFSWSTGGADELSGYALAIAAAWAFGFGLLDRAHIRVDTFYRYLPERLRPLCDLLGAALFLAFFWLILRFGWVVLYDTWRVGTRSRTGLYVPLIVPQVMWWLGICLTVAIAALLLLRSLMHTLAGERAAARKLIGPRALEEEVADELALLDAQRRTEPTAR